MTADEHGEVSTIHIKDELTILAVVLIDGAGVLPKEGEDSLEVAHREVGDTVHLLVAQRLTGLKADTDVREVVLARGGSLLLPRLVKDDTLCFLGHFRLLLQINL